VSQIHDAKLAAMRDIATTGIAKLRKNKDQGYSFRGIEDAMNEMSPVLIRAGITVTPSYSELSITPSESKSGTKLRFATIKGSFKFEAGDGSAMVTECYGEGMDSSDKAVSKAQSVAYRTALFETFVVPLMAVDPEGAEPQDAANEPQGDPLVEAGQNAAMGGMAALTAWWGALSGKERSELQKEFASLRRHAQQIDKEAARA
jgi:hypothetical protein